MKPRPGGCVSPPPSLHLRVQGLAAPSISFFGAIPFPCVADARSSSSSLSTPIILSSSSSSSPSPTSRPYNHYLLAGNLFPLLCPPPS